MRKLWQVIVVCGVLLLPHLASAQATIAGTVRDESGAVLPGVTVQASSPALIEGSREAISDAAGQYSIVNLRPGTYKVAFTLAGFATFVRDGIVLEGAFAAQVNADMKVGALEETVTVSGESPIVDVRSATPSKVLNRDLMNALPAVRVLDRQAAMLPGIQVRIPVDSTGAGQGEVSMYGSKSGDSRWQVDGQPITFGSGGGGSQQALNDSGFEQVSFDDGAGSAEMSTGGVRINAIPKEGGNVFRGQFWGNYAPGWQNDNLTQELKDLNVGGTNKVQYDFDFGPSYGGPIIKDKLWFFTAYRKKGLQQVIFNTFTKTGAPWVQRNQWYQTATGRLTWQASKRDKVAFHYEGNGSRPGAGTPGAASGSGPNQPPEASQTLWVNYAYQTQVKWTSTVTNRLLLEASLYKSYTDGNNGYIYREDVDPFAVSKLDSGTGKRSDAPQATGNHGWTHLYSSKVAATYVTGSHSMKLGMDLIMGHTETLRDLNRGNVTQVTLINGKASTVTVDNSPFDALANMNNDLGLFGQDTWTIDRLTFSGGVRFNWLKMSIPAQSAVAGNFVPARNFDAVNNVPNWKDTMPRFGMSWNVFGNGKTALKGSVGRYLSNEALGFANQFSPLAAATDARSWTDLDNNGSVFQTGTFNVQFNEIGAPRIANFGSARATARLDPDMKRADNWSYSLTVQHELFTGMSVNFGYYRRDYHNCGTSAASGTPTCSSGVTKNLAVDTFNDYTKATFVGPVDSRLPNGGGEVITFYNLLPSKLGATDSFVTSTNNKQTYNGVDFSVSARLMNGATLFGGITSGSLYVNQCDVTNPNDLRFCETRTPWQNEYKLGWNYPLPLRIFWSGTIRTYPGTNVLATYAANSAALGVTLTGGGSLNIQLLSPTARYVDAVKAFDMRFSRNFRLGHGWTAQAFSDIINVPNLATIGGVTNTYGNNWLSPLGAPGGRFVRFGTQIDF